MTEAEAKTKWCPFVRETVLVSRNNPKSVFPPAANRWLKDNGDQMLAKCVGTDCMAWRWSKHAMVGEIEGKPGYAKPKGHCGLVGEE